MNTDRGDRSIVVAFVQRVAADQRNIHAAHVEQPELTAASIHLDLLYPAVAAELRCRAEAGQPWRLRPGIKFAEECAEQLAQKKISRKEYS